VPVTFGFLSTYPPTECGLATFTASLVREIRCVGSPGSAGVVRVVDDPAGSNRPEVAHHLVTSAPGGEAEAARILSRFDVIVVQHEYGIFGGHDGDQVLRVLEDVTSPIIVVLHTVPAAPTPHQKVVLERVIELADMAVCMTSTARRRLVRGYNVDPSVVTVIPHGAPGAVRPLTAPTPGTAPERPTILTWGLLGPGKGIEWGVEALVALRDLEPAPRYLVVGQTHPKVAERDGEDYRESLMALAKRRGVDHLLEFEPRYLDAAALGRIVADADVVLLPYDSTDQVTSGVLVEATAAGKPVIATGFPHAVETLGGGAGLVVAHRDPGAIARAVRRVLCEPGLATRLRAEANTAAPELLWPAVAERYRELATSLVEARACEVA
jgi:glycosyltransferase involved in cell wall biosynthesis